MTSIHAEKIFTGGRLFTYPWKESRPGGVALSGGKIVAVGPSEQIEELAGPSTVRVDARGRLLVPGFQDAHVHPITAGLVYASAYLLETRGSDNVSTVIRNFAASRQPGTWITGWGWYQEDFQATGTLPDGSRRHYLDALTPDNPAYLTRADGHAGWANSAALAAAGVSADTDDPPGGQIERDIHGDPTGVLHERAMLLLEDHIPAPTLNDRLASLRYGQQHLLSLGITGWQDASVFPAEQETYLAAARSGDLIARVAAALRWDADRGLEQLPELIERRAEYRAHNLSAERVKVMQDGVIEGSRTASLLEPYLDPSTGTTTTNSGHSFHEPAELNAIVESVSEFGFGLHFHVIGDRAVREALDALADVRHPLPHRPVLSHIQLIRTDDIDRFAKLGAVASMQPFWAARDSTMTEQTIPFLGTERSARQYPFRALADSGATLAGGSDWMISSASPIDGSHVAVNRQHLGADDEPLFPENALTLDEAFTAYTYGSAAASGWETSSGQLATGFHADLALLDRDPFLGRPEEIGATQVVQTYVAGNLVYEA